MRRIPQREILDGDEIASDEAIRSLGDLRLVNRCFGGVRTTAELLRRAMQRSGLRSASVLEVAAGDGYSIAQATRQLRQERLEVDALCLDRRPLERDVHCCERSMAGDALDLDFAPASFDFVSCGLFLHHLAPEQVVAFIDGALRVARRAVLINDLRRSRLHLGLVHVGSRMFRSPVSRFDGLASVRQAYTPTELHDLLRQSRAAESEVRRCFLFRMAAIAWK